MLFIDLMLDFQSFCHLWIDVFFNCGDSTAVIRSNVLPRLSLLKLRVRVSGRCALHTSKRSAFSSSAFVDSPADRLLTVPHPHLLCVMNSQCHIYIFLILELSSVLFYRFISSLKCSTFPVVFSISFPYFLLPLF